MSGTSVALMANRIIIALDEGDIVLLKEITASDAWELAAQLLQAVAYIEAGVTCKDSFDDFMEGFNS